MSEDTEDYVLTPEEAAANAAYWGAAPAGTPPAVVAQAQAMVANGQASSLAEALKLLGQQGGAGSFFSGPGLFADFDPTVEVRGGGSGPGYQVGRAMPDAEWNMLANQLLTRGLDPSLLEGYRVMVDLDRTEGEDQDAGRMRNPQADMLESIIRSHPSWQTVMSNADVRSRGGALRKLSNKLEPISNPLGIGTQRNLTGRASNFLDDNMEQIVLTALALMSAGAASGAAGAAGASATGAGAAGGAAAGASTSMAQGGSVEDTGRSAGLGALGGAAGGAAAGESAGVGTQAATGAATGAARTALAGGGTMQDYLRSIGRGALGGAAGGGKGEGMLPGDMSEFDMSQNVEGLERAEFEPLVSPEAAQQTLRDIPEPVKGTTLLIGGKQLDITAPDALQQALAALSAPMLSSEPTASEPTAAPAPQSETEQQVKDYAKIAQKVDKLYQVIAGSGSSEQPFPPQGEMSDEEYQRSAVEYLSLDADAMEKAGLKAGTPEYMAYILEQADSIIAQLFGEDPYALLEGESVEDLQNALKDFTDKEVAQLTRALYVMGALGGTTSQSEVTDPFTGISESVGMLPGVEGSEAAHQRGLARTLQYLARLPGQDARGLLSGLLGRDVDLFGLQGNADTQRAQAALQEMQDDEERRKKRKLEEDTYE